MKDYEFLQAGLIFINKSIRQIVVGVKDTVPLNKLR
jgi:hypothetical protein